MPAFGRLRSPLWATATIIVLALATGTLALAARPAPAGPADSVAHRTAACGEADRAELEALLADVQARLDEAVAAGRLSPEVADTVRERLSKLVERCADPATQESDEDAEKHEGKPAGFAFGDLFRECFADPDERATRVEQALTTVVGRIDAAVEAGRLTQERADEIAARLRTFAEQCIAGDPSFRDLFRGMFGVSERHGDRTWMRWMQEWSFGRKTDRHEREREATPAQPPATAPPTATPSADPTAGSRSFGDRFWRSGDRQRSFWSGSGR